MNVKLPLHFIGVLPGVNNICDIYVFPNNPINYLIMTYYNTAVVLSLNVPIMVHENLEMDVKPACLSHTGFHPGFQLVFYESLWDQENLKPLQG